MAGKEILTYGDLLQIVELIKSAEAFSEFHLKIGDIELDLRKADASAAAPIDGQAVAHAGGAQPVQVQSMQSSRPASSSIAPSAAAATPAATAPATATRKSRAAFNVPTGSVAIRSPMVGTFYRAPEPGAKPFVEVGQKVAPDTTVCIIEVMKLMNSIPAGTVGTVTHVLVGDAEPVDAGEVIIVIDPKA